MFNLVAIVFQKNCNKTRYIVFNTEHDNPQAIPPPSGKEKELEEWQEQLMKYTNTRIFLLLIIII